MRYIVREVITLYFLVLSCYYKNMGLPWIKKTLEQGYLEITLPLSVEKVEESVMQPSGTIQVRFSSPTVLDNLKEGIFPFPPSITKSLQEVGLFGNCRVVDDIECGDQETYCKASDTEGKGPKKFPYSSDDLEQLGFPWPTLQNDNPLKDVRMQWLKKEKNDCSTDGLNVKVSFIEKEKEDLSSEKQSPEKAIIFEDKKKDSCDLKPGGQDGESFPKVYQQRVINIFAAANFVIDLASKFSPELAKSFEDGKLPPLTFKIQKIFKEELAASFPYTIQQSVEMGCLDEPIYTSKKSPKRWIGSHLMHFMREPKLTGENCVFHTAEDPMVWVHELFHIFFARLTVQSTVGGWEAALENSEKQFGKEGINFLPLLTEAFADIGALLIFDEKVVAKYTGWVKFGDLFGIRVGDCQSHEESFINKHENKRKELCNQYFKDSKSCPLNTLWKKLKTPSSPPEIVNYIYEHDDEKLTTLRNVWNALADKKKKWKRLESILPKREEIKPKIEYSETRAWLKTYYEYEKAKQLMGKTSQKNCLWSSRRTFDPVIRKGVIIDVLDYNPEINCETEVLEPLIIDETSKLHHGILMTINDFEEIFKTDENGKYPDSHYLASVLFSAVVMDTVDDWSKTKNILSDRKYARSLMLSIIFKTFTRLKKFHLENVRACMFRSFYEIVDDFADQGEEIKVLGNLVGGSIWNENMVQLWNSMDEAFSKRGMGRGFRSVHDAKEMKEAYKCTKGYQEYNEEEYPERFPPNKKAIQNYRSTPIEEKGHAKNQLFLKIPKSWEKHSDQRPWNATWANQEKNQELDKWECPWPLDSK